MKTLLGNSLVFKRISVRQENMHRFRHLLVDGEQESIWPYILIPALVAVVGVAGLLIA